MALSFHHHQRKHRSFSSRRAAGYTLVEIMVTAAVASLVGLVLLSLANATLTLFAKNFSLNESHIRARSVTERLAWKIHQAIEPPKLVNKAGALVAGDGPAAGITCFAYASPEPYYTSNAVNTNSKTIQVNQIKPSQPMPKGGDVILLQYYDPNSENSGTVVATIASVQQSGTQNIKLTFTNDIGTYFDPPPKGVLVIAPNQPFFLLTTCAFIAVPAQGDADLPYSELRYYPTAMSVAKDGQTAFDNRANFRVLSDLSPVSPATECFPFEYNDPQRRAVDVDIRAIARRYSRRSGKSFNFYEHFHTSIAFRSAMQKTLQPN